MQQWIEVNGASLRTDVTGQGRETLVLVHEMGGTLENWDLVLPALSARRRVVRFDLRGHGCSSKMQGVGDFAVMADDIAALLQAIGITEKVAIAGCAFGGGVALRFAARHASRTKALIAMAPATGVAADRRQATLDRARTAEEQGMLPGVDAILDATWPEALRGDMAQFLSHRAKWLANDPYSFAAANRALADLDMTADFPAIMCPTLLVAGKFDQLRPPASIKPFADKIKGARFSEIESGHFMPSQTPDLVINEIEGFLSSVGAGA